MPLPCTPASTSEREDHSQSHSTTDDSGSDEGPDLITPRPGPSDPSKRTPASLSTPLPAIGSWSQRKVCYPTTSEDDGSEPEFPSKLPPGYQPPQPRPSIVPGKSEKGKESLPTTASSMITTQKADSMQAAPAESSSDAARPQKRGSQSGSSDSSTRRSRLRRNRPSHQTQRKLSPPDDPSPRISPRHSPKQSTVEASANASSTSLGVPERTRSITFSPASSLRPPSDVGISSVYTMSRRRESPAINSAARRESPAISPAARHDFSDGHDMESSADENTAIFRRSNSGRTGERVGSTLSYGTNAALIASTTRDDDVRFPGYEGAAEEEEEEGGSRLHPPSPIERRRKSGANKHNRSSPNRGRDPHRRSSHDSSSSSRTDPDGSWSNWWRSAFEKYGSVELENKGSVARDHLALERTFLAWLRTSLSFASIGIAVTQLFRLNTSISNNDSSSSSSSSGHAFTPATNLRDPLWMPPPSALHTQSVSSYEYARLRQVGKPLGATFLGISILILLLGFHRYFESQHYVIRGKFPASRGSVVIVAALSAGLIVASLTVVLVVAPSAFEKR